MNRSTIRNNNNNIGDLTVAQGVGASVEYISFALSQILYLRGVYPANSFKQIEHASTGLSLFVSNDGGVTGYLGAVLSQIALWLSTGKLKALSIVIFPDKDPSSEPAAAAGDVIERWTFQFRRDTNTVDASVSTAHHAAQTSANHLTSALRHLVASAGMLPARKGKSAFEIITYNDSSVNVPKSWEASDPMELEGADELPLRPFNAGGLLVDGFITFFGE